MRKLHFLLFVLAFGLNACLPAAFQQPEATPPPAPDLNATAAILSQQTLEALPTRTEEPSATSVPVTPSETATQATATETQNPILLTLTATLGTGTVSALPGAADLSGSGTPTFTATPSPTAASIGLTPTETAHPIHSGTMPPSIPFGFIELRNKSKSDVYISMRCVTKEGYVTIIEYPVDSFVNAKAPAGKYTYVAWVGGRKFLGSFSLSRNQDLTITVFKKMITIK
ncbi:MAG: hypothetical protein K8S20_16965 [Chloroflexi bacterium]|nr:hypothetical protein [Chloroflexota bacterium]